MVWEPIGPPAPTATPTAKRVHYSKLRKEPRMTTRLLTRI